VGESEGAAAFRLPNSERNIEAALAAGPLPILQLGLSSHADT
jgi:hypothetical protein